MSGGEGTRHKRQDGGEGPQSAEGAPHDEFEIEVSRIGAASDSPLPAGSRHSTSLSSVRQASPFGARFSAQRRVIAALSAGGAVLLALIVVLATLPGAVPTLQGALGLAPPTPTATLALNANTVLVTHTVPWGSLTVDGKVTALSDYDTQYALLPKLARGTHTLAYTAEPFPTIRCRLSVPPNNNDTCASADNGTRIIFPNPGALRIIDLQATPDHLPDDQYAALEQAIEAALAVPGAALQTGDHYLSGTGKTVTASTPLTAHLIVTLPARGTQATNINGTDVCDPLCTWQETVDTGSLAGPWNIAALVRFQWQFAASSGNVIDTSAPPALNLQLMQFQVAWNQSWTASTVPPDLEQSLLCLPAESQVQQLVPVRTNGGQSGGAQWDNDTADGCMIQIFASGANGGATPATGGTWTILSRFGALIAGDSVTERAFPQFLVASANERAIIARIRAQQ